MNTYKFNEETLWTRICSLTEISGMNKPEIIRGRTKNKESFLMRSMGGRGEFSLETRIR